MEIAAIITLLANLGKLKESVMTLVSGVQEMIDAGISEKDLEMESLEATVKRLKALGKLKDSFKLPE